MNRILCNVSKAIMLGLIFFQITNCISQTLLPKWSRDPYNEKVFIENKGQFTSLEKELNCKILFVFEQGNTKFILCNDGYIVQESKEVIENNKEDKEDDPAKEHQRKISYSNLWFGFKSVNNNVLISGQKKSGALNKYYLPDHSGKKRMINAAAYSEVVYKNIYDGIDLVFYAQEKTGMKYKYIVQPYSYASLKALSYNGNGAISLDKSGNIHAGISGEEIIDYAPKVYYADDAKEIPSEYVLRNNSYSISINSYDQSKVIIVDPWVVNPNFTSLNIAYDIASDPAGYVYVYGGYIPWKLKKFTPLGNLDWTFVTTFTDTALSSNWIGGMAVDGWGNTFLTEGCCDGNILKVDSTGVVGWNVQHGSSNNPYEFWRIAFNCDYSKLYLANAYSSGNPLAESLNLVDTSNGTISNSTIAFSTNQEEPRALCVAPNGNVFAMSCEPNFSTSPDEVVAMTPALVTVFTVTDDYDFPYQGPNYSDPVVCGQDAISAGTYFFCTTDGGTVYKRNLSTGATIASLAIPGGNSQTNSGIYVDGCNNIFVGSINAVLKYDSAFNLLATLTTSDTVISIAPGIGGDLLVCGHAFIHEFSASVCSSSSAAVSINTSTCTNPFTLTATASGTNYLWSNAATTQSITITASGTYTCHITGATGCNSNVTDTFNITILPAFTVHIGNDTSICTGDSVTLNAGNTGDHYLWSTGATTQTITAHTAGTYWVQVNNGACTVNDTVVISVSNSITVNLGQDTSICSGTNIILNAGNAGFTYHWSNGATTQTISVDSAHTYSVTISNGGGCTGIGTRSITVNPLPTPLIIGDSVFCSGNTSVLNPGSFNHYSWSNGSTSQTITVNSSNTYIVTVTNISGCTATASKNIIVNPSPSFTINGDSAICFGDSTTLSVGTFSQYLWNTGNTTQSIVVNSTNTYSVTATNSFGCTGTASETVTTVHIPTVTSSFIADTLSGCNPLTVTLTNTSINGTSYLWKFGDDSTATTMNATHIYVTSGSFKVILIATNSGPCGVFIDTSIQQTTISIDEPIKITSKFTAEPLSGCAPLAITFTNSSTNGANYYWYFGDGGFDTTRNPIHIYDSGSYHIYLIAYNNTNRCINPPDSSGLLITVENCALSIPNVFSPNGDGKNDFFNLLAEGYTNFHLIIFDRWGVKIFESSNALNQWNGRVNNTGGDCPDGTYYYIFTANDPNGSPFSYKGFISLIR